MDDGGWLANALGEGWLLKTLGALLIPVSAIAGWIVRRPMEKAGIRHQLDQSMTAHLQELRADITRLREERVEDQAQCDRDLEQLRLQIRAVMTGEVPAYILGERKSFKDDES